MRSTVSLNFVQTPLKNKKNDFPNKIVMGCTWRIFLLAKLQAFFMLKCEIEVTFFHFSREICNLSDGVCTDTHDGAQIAKAKRFSR